MITRTRIPRLPLSPILKRFSTKPQTPHPESKEPQSESEHARAGQNVVGMDLPGVLPPGLGLLLSFVSLSMTQADQACCAHTHVATDIEGDEAGVASFEHSAPSSTTFHINLHTSKIRTPQGIVEDLDVTVEEKVAPGSADNVNVDRLK